ncbi:MAG: hypothetical protein AUI36_25970 [Cyanobacteria bacterium 13_1_40CM_2_61_4]|nr:MAG: hypothetical protein AUI36_25970 [Cyanobacteria bacterium 13_1_40CM_2_61_4]
MKLPNAENAVIDIEKLRGYSLSPTNPKGKHKARLFRKKLGMELDDAEILRQAIQKAIFMAEAIERKPTAYGRIFRVDFMAGRGKGIIWYEAKVRSGWIIRNDEDFPRLTTCFNPNKSR